MTEDEGRNKKQAEQRFYLELQQTHGGHFEAMLAPEERGFWDALPPAHKTLLQWSRDWEWEVKQGLENFNNVTPLSKFSTVQDRAFTRWKDYQKAKSDCKKIMQFDKLSDLLFPFVLIRHEFVENRDSYAKQEIARLMREAADSVAENRRLEPDDWEDYGIHAEWLDVRWMETQDSDHLKQCAIVWRGYLPVEQMSPPAALPGIPTAKIAPSDRKAKQIAERVAAYNAVCEDSNYSHLGEEKRRDIAGGKVNPKVSGVTIWRALEKNKG